MSLQSIFRERSVVQVMMVNMTILEVTFANVL